MKCENAPYQVVRWKKIQFDYVKRNCNMKLKILALLSAFCGIFTKYPTKNLSECVPHLMLWLGGPFFREASSGI